jgi:hypothetical protein
VLGEVVRPRATASPSAGYPKVGHMDAANK